MEINKDKDKDVNYIERNIFIDNIPLEKARQQYEQVLDIKVVYEEISVHTALNRITGEPVFARMSSPHYNGAAMDGIVVKAERTYGASEKTPELLSIDKDFQYINTGNPIPKGNDSVIMIEDVDKINEDTVRIMQPAYPWQHIRPVGEDIVKGEMIIPSRHRIRPMDLGALLSGGIESVKVYPKVKVGILPTGNEIMQNTTDLVEGQIIDSNSKMFEGMAIESGGIPLIYSPVEDNPGALRNAILKAVNENDIVVINAGSSAGSKDYTVKIMRELGQVIVHGIAVKPGKPTILGIINQKCVIGIPGYPVSAFFSFEMFVKPIIEKYSGMDSDEESCEAYLSQRVNSSLKHEEFVRVTLGEIKGKYIATPLSRGAGNTMSLVKADGVLIVPRQSEGVESGTKVTIKLFKSIKSIVKRLVIIGSHDLILDVIADSMPLTSGHVGSLGGIMAMKRSECHIAPIHLLNEEDGTYNNSYVRKYFEQGTMAIISGVKRLQGLMVQKGNPKKILGFTDLVREDVSFVNRQRGSGTRQLLDYELKSNNIEVIHIIGYNREMNTHMAVAATVASNGADVALGTYSAAKAMDLDFIPVGYEAYEFLVKKEFLEEERVLHMIQILQSEEFKKQLEDIGGYKVEEAGQIRIVGETIAGQL